MSDETKEFSTEKETFIGGFKKEEFSELDMIKRKYLVTLLVSTAILIFHTSISILLFLMIGSSNLAGGFAVFLEILFLVLELIVICLIYSIGTQPFNACTKKLAEIIFLKRNGRS